MQPNGLQLWASNIAAVHSCSRLIICWWQLLPLQSSLWKVNVPLSWAEEQWHWATNNDFGGRVMQFYKTHSHTNLTVAAYCFQTGSIGFLYIISAGKLIDRNILCISVAASFQNRNKTPCKQLLYLTIRTCLIWILRWFFYNIFQLPATQYSVYRLLWF